MEPRVLVTGDYWHRDFESVLKGFSTVTLVSLEKISTVIEESFDLAVIAQSRPDEFSQEKIEQLQAQLGNTPLVAVLGSWCEGELRTGHPWPGVIRVYWHQWQGRFAKFAEQLESEGITNWHAEKTFTTADRILKPNEIRQRRKIETVGISSWTQNHFEMLRDAVSSFGWETKWIERCTWDADHAEFCNPIVIDADSYSAELENRIRWLQSEFPGTRFLLVLSFPRVDDVKNLRNLGISQVVSKPFELDDLKTAIEETFEQTTPKSTAGETSSSP